LIVVGDVAVLLIYFTGVKKTAVKKWRRGDRTGTLNLSTTDYCDTCGSSLKEEETKTY